MWNWEKAFSYCCCICQKSRQIPQNTELGFVLYWWLEREHCQVIFPKICSGLCLLASPSINNHWRCARCLRSEQHFMECHSGSCPATALLMNVSSLGLVSNCKFPASVGSPFFCGVSELSISVLSVSCPSHWHDENYWSTLGQSSAGLRETWKRGLGGKWHLKISAFSIQDDAFRPYWSWAAYCISLPNHNYQLQSSPCHWNTDLSSGCSVWEECSQQSSLLISS